jgi:hypothetical protein
MELGHAAEDWVATKANWEGAITGLKWITVSGDGALAEAFNDKGSLAELTYPITLRSPTHLGAPVKQFKYVGPYDEVEVPALGVVVAQGETVQVEDTDVSCGARWAGRRGSTSRTRSGRRPRRRPRRRAPTTTPTARRADRWL